MCDASTYVCGHMCVRGQPGFGPPVLPCLKQGVCFLFTDFQILLSPGHILLKEYRDYSKVWDLNSGPQAWTTSDFPIEPFPQSLIPKVFPYLVFELFSRKQKFSRRKEQRPISWCISAEVLPGAKGLFVCVCFLFSIFILCLTE